MLRTLIVLGAIGSGGAAAWISTTMIASQPLPSVVVAEQPIPRVEILVADRDLPAGAVLRPGDLRWQSWPEELLLAGAMRRDAQPGAPEAFSGQMVRIALTAGEPLRADKLIQAQGGYLSVLLEPGKRAVAVRISVESTAGGFIMPNDHVDVLRTFSRQGPSGQSEMVSETILSNVRVLAIDQSTDTRNSETVLGKTATLELEASEVEIVTAGEASGLLSLALRAFADNAEERRIMHQPVAAAPTTIRISRGGVVEQVDLR